ncbi:hypothetical protein PybrP1_009801 [[Pythium] brassicae (nom. inval.)]|nr:hypothetical protein PybrP1_009801 [[Pythium] brassicae (nom. inval.)]
MMHTRPKVVATMLYTLSLPACSVHKRRRSLALLDFEALVVKVRNLTAQQLRRSSRLLGCQPSSINCEVLSTERCATGQDGWIKQRLLQLALYTGPCLQLAAKLSSFRWQRHTAISIVLRKPTNRSIDCSLLLQDGQVRAAAGARVHPAARRRTGVREHLGVDEGQQSAQNIQYPIPAGTCVIA